MTFKKFNANPENKNIGDCSIRAGATPLPPDQEKRYLKGVRILLTFLL